MAATRVSEQDALLDVRAAARLVDRSPETIRRWVWSGGLAARRDGHRLLISRDDLREFVARQGARATPALAEWARVARDALAATEQQPGGSATDLVLADRRQRAGGRLEP